MNDTESRIRYTPSADVVDAVLLYSARTLMLYTSATQRHPKDSNAEAAREAAMRQWWGVTNMLHPWLPTPPLDTEEGQAELQVRAVEVCRACPDCFATMRDATDEPVHYTACPQF